MANNRILLKKSSVPNKVPGASDIEYGEVALNFSDGRLYFKNSDNNIDFFESGVKADSESILPFSANEGNFGSVSSNISQYGFELGSLTETNFFSHDLGDINKTLSPDRFVLPSFTVEKLLSGTAGEMVFVTNEVSGSVPAFYDGSNWRRLSDNQIVSTT